MVLWRTWEARDWSPQESDRTGRGEAVRLGSAGRPSVPCVTVGGTKSESYLEIVLSGRQMGSIQKTGEAQTKG